MVKKEKELSNTRKRIEEERKRELPSTLFPSFPCKPLFLLLQAPHHHPPIPTSVSLEIFIAGNLSSLHFSVLATPCAVNLLYEFVIFCSHATHPNANLR
uniref:Uncharacterized protein n=1 Tax=Rhizophora mucronata TaxID=61149 RepID=A0A2P2KLD3_RHIMU